MLITVVVGERNRPPNAMERELAKTAEDVVCEKGNEVEFGFAKKAMSWRKQQRTSFAKRAMTWDVVDGSAKKNLRFSHDPSTALHCKAL